MKHPLLQLFESKHIRETPLPRFRAGDSVVVWVKIQEGADKEGKAKFRLQAFEGTVIRFRKGTTNSTFLVRKVAAGGVSVERNFFVNSPFVDKVEVKSHGKVRQSRIYYIKKLKGKAARIVGRFVPQAPSTTPATPK